MTDSAAASPTVPSAGQEPFPPQTIEAFLRCCAGEWMSLRSQFRLGISGDEEAEAWHNSERGELLVHYLVSSPAGNSEPESEPELEPEPKAEPESESEHEPESDPGPEQGPGSVGPGGIQIIPKVDGVRLNARTLQFAADGQFTSEAAGGTGAPVQRGHWTLWPDGSLELVMTTDSGDLREKIWFTKANLRLRSTVQTRRDGTPGLASFSSEIRRVSRPAAPTS